MKEDKLVETALDLANDIVRAYAKPSQYTTGTLYSDTMRRLSAELYNRHTVMGW